MQIIYSFILIFSLLSTAIFAQEQIGVAAAVNRNTTDLTLEQERKLVEAGYQIIQNHTIETDEIGKAQMLLLDGTAFSVGPNSSVVLDRFIYNPETAEGSLEVTARGLLRIVGGKVTKKQPALIRTNSATVGIRGGIGIVQTDGSQVNATFLYGEEMTVTPNCVDLDTFGDQCGSDFITTITEPGFSVTVESADSEPSEPEPVTEESLEAVQDELEASEEEPAEEESSSDESSSEESSDESSMKKVQMNLLAKKAQMNQVLKSPQAKKVQMILAQTNLPVMKTQMIQVLTILPAVMNPQAHQMNLAQMSQQLVIVVLMMLLQTHQAMNPPPKLLKKLNQILKSPLKLLMLVAMAERLKLKSMKGF